MYNNYKIYIMKYIYKLNILNLKYLIIAFLKTNITINVIIYHIYLLFRSIRTIYILFFNAFNIQFA